MAIEIKQPATTGSEGYGIWMITDPVSGSSARILEAVRRAQSIDVSADTGDEAVNELGNEGVVEYKSDTPTVSISISGNQVAKDIVSDDVAGLQWLALIANRTPSGSATGGSTEARREKNFIIGEPVKIHNETDSSSIITDDFDEIISSPNDSDSVVNAVTTDILVPIKRGESLNRVFAIGQAATTSLGWTFPVDGMATFDISLEADNFTFYQSTYNDVDIKSYEVPNTYAANNQQTIDAAAAVYRVYLDGEELDEAASESVLNVNDARAWYLDGTTTLKFSNNLLSKGSKIRVWMQNNGADDPAWSGGTGINYGLTSDAGDQGALRRENIEVYLILDTTSSYLVEGFAISSINSADNEVQIEVGTAYITNSSTGTLDLYDNNIINNFDFTAIASTDADVTHKVYIASDTSGNLIRSTTTGTVADNGILLGTINAFEGDVNSFNDTRSFGYGMSLLQNLSISLDLSRTSNYQLGTEKAIERSLNKPVPISVDFSALDADGAIMTMLRGGNYASITDADKEIRLSELSQTLGILVNLYESATHTDATKKIAMVVSDAKAGSISLSDSIGGNGEMSVTLNADRFSAHECNFEASGSY